jgi:hypothetical protein
VWEKYIVTTRGNIVIQNKNNGCKEVEVMRKFERRTQRSEAGLRVQHSQSSLKLDSACSEDYSGDLF